MARLPAPTESHAQEAHLLCSCCWLLCAGLALLEEMWVLHMVEVPVSSFINAGSKALRECTCWSQSPPPFYSYGYRYAAKAMAAFDQTNCTQQAYIAVGREECCLCLRLGVMPGQYLPNGPVDFGHLSITTLSSSHTALGYMFGQTPIPDGKTCTRGLPGLVGACFGKVIAERGRVFCSSGSASYKLHPEPLHFLQLCCCLQATPPVITLSCSKYERL